jgi:hypothetical protein
MATTVTLDFISNDPATGSVTLPLGLIVGHAHSTTIPTLWDWTFQAQTDPGAVALTDGGSQQNARIIGGGLVDWWFYRWLWLWTFPPDAAQCANAQLDFRAGANPGSGWVYSAWSVARAFSGGGPMGGSGGSGIDPTTLFQYVAKVFQNAP